MASLTRSALRQAAQQNLGIKDRDSDFNRWIDQGLKRIAGEHDFKALKDSESSTMTASTGTSIDFPSNYKSMRSFVKSSSMNSFRIPATILKEFLCFLLLDQTRYTTCIQYQMTTTRM